MFGDTIPEATWSHLPKRFSRVQRPGTRQDEMIFMFGVLRPYFLEVLGISTERLFRGMGPLLKTAWAAAFGSSPSYNFGTP